MYTFPSPTRPIGAVFEDDGDTGHFYATDFTAPANPIVDALHAHNVADIAGRDKTSRLGIIWPQGASDTRQ